jgi:hypothetical protein
MTASGDFLPVRPCARERQMLSDRAAGNKMAGRSKMAHFFRPYPDGPSRPVPPVT